MKVYAYLIVICSLLCLVGCGDYYSEGDIVAAETWEKMTTNEKSMYEKVQDKWGEEVLKYIREEIRKRKIKPDADAIPFYDIANLIKTTNDINLIPRDKSSDSDIQRKYEAKKFSSIDPKWYYKYIDPQGGKFNKKADMITNTGFKKPVSEAKPKKAPKPKKSAREKISEVKTYSIEDLISEDMYPKVRRLVRNCEHAREVLEQVVAARRPLTKIDFETIKERSLYCKTLRLMEE